MNGITEGMNSMDEVVQFSKSIIHHGSYNDRVYLLKYSKEEKENFPERLKDFAISKGYSKIIAKVPSSVQSLFIEHGYNQEAFIPSFYKNNEDVLFMVMYLSDEREVLKEKNLQLLAHLINKKSTHSDIMDDRFSIEMMDESRSVEMADIYKKVFQTYPFPITDSGYIKSTMQDGDVIYFGVFDKGNLVGLSSSELDKENRNAEMTDFAVLPEYRGFKLAYHLLSEMEEQMKRMQFKILYTIARLNSPGMNKTFINHAYKLSGILKNNTNIGGQIESMNVYYKKI